MANLTMADFGQAPDTYAPVYQNIAAAGAVGDALEGFGRAVGSAAAEVEQRKREEQRVALDATKEYASQQLFALGRDLDQQMRENPNDPDSWQAMYDDRMGGVIDAVNQFGEQRGVHEDDMNVLSLGTQRSLMKHGEIVSSRASQYRINESNAILEQGATARVNSGDIEGATNLINKTTFSPAEKAEKVFALNSAYEYGSIGNEINITTTEANADGIIEALQQRNEDGTYTAFEHLSQNQRLDLTNKAQAQRKRIKAAKMENNVSSIRRQANVNAALALNHITAQANVDRMNMVADALESGSPATLMNALAESGIDAETSKMLSEAATGAQNIGEDYIMLDWAKRLRNSSQDTEYRQATTYQRLQKDILDTTIPALEGLRKAGRLSQEQYEDAYSSITASAEFKGEASVSKYDDAVYGWLRNTFNREGSISYDQITTQAEDMGLNVPGRVSIGIESLMDEIMADTETSEQAKLDMVMSATFFAAVDANDGDWDRSWWFGRSLNDYEKEFIQTSMTDLINRSMKFGMAPNTVAASAVQIINTVKEGKIDESSAKKMIEERTKMNADAAARQLLRL